MEFIPNGLVYLIETFGKKRTLSQIKNIISISNPDNLAIFEEYLEFLQSREYIFFCTKEELELFPPVDLRWDSPYEITNIILDGDHKLPFDFGKIVGQLESLGCLDVQFRFFKPVTLDYLEHILGLIDKARIKSVEILMPYPDYFAEEPAIEQFLRKYLRVCRLYLHSVTQLDQEYARMESDLADVVFTRQALGDESHCGAVGPSFFTSNIKSFSEAMHFNNCLNRKISIDRRGFIRNCPSMKDDYGHIQHTTLQEALAHEGFKKVWSIKKDDIAVCKTCEFRYVCSDCRAYLETPEDALSKPLKCGYNPESCNWSDWQTIPEKQPAISFYESLKQMPFNQLKSA